MEEQITVTPMTAEQAKTLGVDDWARWECEPSEFDWYYSDRETAYVFEGDVTVRANGTDTRITAGNLVVFPKGMNCVWMVHRTIKKAYRFGD